jgi:hypothetical protein
MYVEICRLIYGDCHWKSHFVRTVHGGSQWNVGPEAARCHILKKKKNNQGSNPSSGEEKKGRFMSMSLLICD